MTFPDPEEQDREGPSRQSSPKSHSNPEDRSPEDTDAAFAGIVAGLRPEFDVPRRPAESRPAEDDHFEPPEPLRLPVPRPRTMGGLALLAVGVLLLIGPSLLGLSEDVATPLGLLTLTAGIGWLVLGLRSGPPSEGWDDGARL